MSPKSPTIRKEGTHMKETIEALRQSFEKELQAAQNSDVVERLRVA